MLANSLDKEYILKELRFIKAELSDRYKVSKIGIFGSVARNEANENSDIDIVVEMEPNMLKRASLKTELESRFGRKVDVIRYRNNMNAYLKSRIDEDAIYA
ncbi:nucleotidyltransferase family protein [Pseudanabaena sp. BC1403]|uniref:nucleotidyltransferase family protein n=1 Tax=Pseudanabaena sp. BC1403 TaxID=2043171 RepID=UPI000CD9BB4D|nr:nucleotidyltransferase family protein [Pseudanabaena sp. BC1403]